MILSGEKIEQELGKGLFIEPFSKESINPNSYNLKLHNELLVYTSKELDMKKDNPYKRVVIPEEGFLLEPGNLYLGRTLEKTFTPNFVPMLEGRSSVGRLGIAIHITAGFGDVGFNGYWTLEIYCVHPVRIYPFVEICQIYYHTICGDYKPYNSGKYQLNNDIQTSMLYKELK